MLVLSMLLGLSRTRKQRKRGGFITLGVAGITMDLGAGIMGGIKIVPAENLVDATLSTVTPIVLRTGWGSDILEKEPSDKPRSAITLNIICGHLWHKNDPRSTLTAINNRKG